MPPTGNSTHEMVLVYDAKRQTRQTSFSEGHITRLYYLPYDGEHMFEIDEGARRSSWPRPSDSSWFVVGYRARIDHTTGEHPQVLRIWIGQRLNKSRHRVSGDNINLKFQHRSIPVLSASSSLGTP